MKRKRKIKKSILNILLVIFVIIFIYSSTKTFSLIHNHNTNNKEVKKIQEKVITNKDKIQKQEDVKEAEKEPPLILNFDELENINSDTVGWIEIRNTNINYPIVQAKDNEYYLNHSFYKKKNGDGWIFLNSNNSSNFNDLNTVIFGHDTRERNMFSDVKKLYDGLLGDYIPITIYTRKGTYHYVTFSLFLVDENDNQYLKNYLTADDITQALKNSKYDFKMVATPSDNILTLSTCYYSHKQKVILLAVRV